MLKNVFFVGLPFEDRNVDEFLLELNERLLVESEIMKLASCWSLKGDCECYCQNNPKYVQAAYSILRGRKILKLEKMNFEDEILSEYSKVQRFFGNLRSYDAVLVGESGLMYQYEEIVKERLDAKTSIVGSERSDGAGFAVIRENVANQENENRFSYARNPKILDSACRSFSALRQSAKGTVDGYNISAVAHEKGSEIRNIVDAILEFKDL